LMSSFPVGVGAEGERTESATAAGAMTTRPQNSGRG
jgi:hypothetical protein